MTFLSRDRDATVAVSALTILASVLALVAAYLHPDDWAAVSAAWAIMTGGTWSMLYAFSRAPSSAYIYCETCKKYTRSGLRVAQFDNDYYCPKCGKWTGKA